MQYMLLIYGDETAAMAMTPEEQESSMARNILRHAAVSSEEGRIDLAGHV